MGSVTESAYKRGYRDGARATFRAQAILLREVEGKLAAIADEMVTPDVRALTQEVAHLFDRLADVTETAQRIAESPRRHPVDAIDHLVTAGDVADVVQLRRDEDPGDQSA